nr:MAG TPA: hypothetical protein [Caudoviricetes sp.]
MTFITNYVYTSLFSVIASLISQEAIGSNKRRSRG